MSDAARRFPEWYRSNVDISRLTEARLAEMRAEAKECDEHNMRAFAVVRAAHEAYKLAARDYGGSVETVRRNGRTYMAVPWLPITMVVHRCEQIERRFAEEKKRQEEEARLREAQAEQKKRQRAADVELAKLIVRYGAPEESDWEDVLESLRAKSKFLDLAIAGMETRGDWSDGFHRVAGALRRFRVEDERDKEIVADLVDCMGHDDGRVFRDTAWNYDRLFGLVEDQQLVADAKRCSEIASLS